MKCKNCEHRKVVYSKIFKGLFTSYCEHEYTSYGRKIPFLNNFYGAPSICPINTGIGRYIDFGRIYKGSVSGSLTDYSCSEYGDVPSYRCSFSTTVSRTNRLRKPTPPPPPPKRVFSSRSLLDPVWPHE